MTRLAEVEAAIEELAGSRAFVSTVYRPCGVRVHDNGDGTWLVGRGPTDLDAKKDLLCRLLTKHAPDCVLDRYPGSFGVRLVPESAMFEVLPEVKAHLAARALGGRA